MVTNRAHPARPLPALFAGAVAFLMSGAVLVLEIVAGRLLAPYVGVTLETTSAIIGTVLGGIAVGTWVGGRLADRFDPGAVLPVVVLLGGAATFAVLPLVRTVAKHARRGPAAAVVLSAIGFLLPALVLSTVGPLLVRQQLKTFDTAGRTVARISSLGTIGAIFGSFLTGFVLVSRFSTDTIVLGAGGVLVVLGLVLAGWGRTTSRALFSAALVVTAGTGTTSRLVHSACQRETRYVCLNVNPDPGRTTGRFLELDDVLHSYVDVKDPKYLDFEYIQAIASVIDASTPPGRPIRALHIGGGGFTIPRYVAATRPGSTNVVLERDPDLLAIGRQQLGLVVSPTMRVLTGDARVTLRSQPKGRWDVVVGDAFGGEQVPWHLATKEFLQSAKDRLRPGGVYVMNLIDGPPLGFAKAELATLRAIYKHTALISLEEGLAARVAANFVYVASDRALPLAAIMAAQAKRSAPLVAIDEPAKIDRFQGKAIVLTDNFAPVDQLFTP